MYVFMYVCVNVMLCMYVCMCELNVMYVCNLFARRFSDMLPFDFMLIRRHVNAIDLYTLSVRVYYVLSKTGSEGGK